MKKIIIAMLTLVAMTGQAKTYKTIKAPVAISDNLQRGKLEARKVIMRDTATTIQFTMKYPKGEYFRLAKDSYLTDEDGNRYALHSADGLRLDSWVMSPESGVTNFTMHFEPMPKRVQVFDFIEGNARGAFMLLGIHDRNTKLNIPTFQELSQANPYTLPSDWFSTDTVTIRGRIEGYDAEQFGFTSMECYYEDIFEKDDATQVLDIAPDGSFEKKFKVSYPILQYFWTEKSDVGFSEIPFFARPGDTVDITVRKNALGHYECFYNSGSSKDVERWLKARELFSGMTNALRFCKGNFNEAKTQAENVWQNMMYHIGAVSRRCQFTPLETQLALAEAQVEFAYAMFDYAMYREDDVMRTEVHDGVLKTMIAEGAEWDALGDMENYKQLRRVDFDNSLLLTSSDFPIMVNRIEFSGPVRARQFDSLENKDGIIESNVLTARKSLANICAAMRELTGCGHESLTAQLCLYRNMLGNFGYWHRSEESIPLILADTMRTRAEREADVASLETVSNMMPAYLALFTHPYVHQKAEQFYALQMAQKGLSTPLPSDNAAADLIRNLSAKYPGRFLIIDFWGMGCGPCRASIQSSKEKRAEIAKRDDVKLIFIAGERTAGGSDAYKKYVEEWLSGEETVCVSNTEFARLQELFHFNGIPHYETITPDCQRVRDDLKVKDFYNFDYELQQLIERLK